MIVLFIPNIVKHRFIVPDCDRDLCIAASETVRKCQVPLSLVAAVMHLNQIQKFQETFVMLSSFVFSCKVLIEIPKYVWN